MHEGLYLHDELPALRVLCKSLGGTGSMGSYGGLQFHIGGYTDIQVAVKWSLGGGMGSYGGIKFHARGLAGSGCCSMIYQW